MRDIDLLNNISNARTSNYHKDLIDILILARATPSLASRLYEIEQVTEWFRKVFAGGLKEEDLTGYWFDFVNMVMQRYSLLFSDELSAADNLVANFYWRFLENPALNSVGVTYQENVTPLVFLGKGGAQAYYTLPTAVKRPLAIIHMPRAALNNVWRWTVLSHETGHDIFFCINNLAGEIKALVTYVVERELSLRGRPYITGRSALEVNGPAEMEHFGVLLWRAWVNEIYADVFSILMCGPAFIYTMQELVGFDNVGEWKNGPDEHPLPLVRNFINIMALRQLGLAGEADRLERRVRLYAPPVRELIWVDSQKRIAARASLDIMLLLAERVTDAILHTPLISLNNHSLRQIINFNPEDLEIIMLLANSLIDKMPPPAIFEARHLVAAAQLAFEKQPFLAEKIHGNTLNFLHGSQGMPGIFPVFGLKNYAKEWGPARNFLRNSIN